MARHNTYFVRICIICFTYGLDAQCVGTYDGIMALMQLHISDELALEVQPRSTETSHFIHIDSTGHESGILRVKIKSGIISSHNTFSKNTPDYAAPHSKLAVLFSTSVFHDKSIGIVRNLPSIHTSLALVKRRKFIDSGAIHFIGSLHLDAAKMHKHNTVKLPVNYNTPGAQ